MARRLYDLDRLTAQVGDLVPLAVVDQVGGDHVRAAARRDDRIFDVIREVLQRNTAGRHDFEHREGRAHGLDLGHAARLLSREELEHFQAELVRGVVIGRGGAAREHVDAHLLAVFDQLGIHARGDDELRARGHGLIHLPGGEHGARADQHFGELLAHGLDGDGRARGAEGDLGHRHAARDQRLGQRRRVALGVVQLDDRHHADLGNALLQIIHGNAPLYIRKSGLRRRPAGARAPAQADGRIYARPAIWGRIMLMAGI